MSNPKPTRKRAIIALSVFGVLMVVTGLVTYLVLNPNSIFANSGQQTTTTYSGPLNCPSGTYQGNYNGQQECLYDPGSSNAGQPAPGYFGPAATATSSGGCFGCVFITQVNVVIDNGGEGGYVSNPMPNSCVTPSWSTSAAGLAGIGMGTLTPDGSAVEVVGPSQNGQSARSFAYNFHINLAYGTQSDGTDCSMGEYVDSVSLSNGASGVVLQSVTPSTPYDIVNIGDSGGSQVFGVQFYSLDGNYYYGALTLTLVVSSG